MHNEIYGVLWQSLLIYSVGCRGGIPVHVCHRRIRVPLYEPRLCVPQ